MGLTVLGLIAAAAVSGGNESLIGPARSSSLKPVQLGLEATGFDMITRSISFTSIAINRQQSDSNLLGSSIRLSPDPPEHENFVCIINGLLQKVYSVNADATSQLQMNSTCVQD